MNLSDEEARMKIYEFRGSARRVGREQGEAFGEAMASYVEKHCQFPHLSRRRREEIALGLLKEVDGFCPPVAEEIRGMAEGSGLPLVDVCADSFQNFLGFVPAEEECSNIVFRTSDRGPLLGKNTDLEKEAPRHTALLAKHYDTGLSMAGYAYRGKVSMQGVSSAGLAIGGSSVTLKEEAGVPKGFPDSIVMVSLLHKCATTADAVRLLRDVPFFGKGLNLALVDAGGDAAVVEISSSHRHVIQPGEERALACTNFLLSGGAEHTASPAYVANAEARYRIIRRMVDRADRLPLELMLCILRHRADRGVSVCQRDEQLDMHSRPSYVAMPAERAILLTDDYPDKSEFIEYSL